MNVVFQCLGLPNKKDIVTNYLNTHSISVCCLQETEVSNGFPENILNCGNYNLELELNTTKKRVGTYIRKGVPYTRKFELEKPDHHVVVIDVNAGVNLRIIVQF